MNSNSKDRSFKQLSELSRFKLVSLRIRLHQIFSTFVIKAVCNNNFKSLVNRIKMSSKAIRSPYLQPRLKSLYGEPPFSNFAPKILDKFSFSFILFSLFCHGKVSFVFLVTMLEWESLE